MVRSSFSRRAFIGTSLASVVAGYGNIQLSHASVGTGRPLLVVVLRGALDGLGAVPHFGDNHIEGLRGGLLPPPPGSKNGALALDHGFALHPALKSLHKFYQQGQASVLHATAMPHGTRSHFDAQDWLETGGENARDGWLNRALQLLDPSVEALGVGANLPLILRGKRTVGSWAPPTLPEVHDGTLTRLMDLYAGDPILEPSLASAISLGDVVEMDGQMRRAGRRGPNNTAPIFEATAKLMKSGSADVAVLSLSGWDTHANQGAETGTLARRLTGLDKGLQKFRDAMGPDWQKTAVLIATEFGRTVAMNGTKGTDHGTAGAAFLVGGAVNGGKMLGDWPGLAPSSLYQGRDLRLANDLRGLVKGVLNEHLQIEQADINRHVFTGSQSVRSLSNLIKTV